MERPSRLLQLAWRVQRGDPCLSCARCDAAFRRQDRDGEAEEIDLPGSWVPIDDAVALVLRGEIGNPTAVVGVLAVAEARRMNWTTLRPVDTHWPVRDHLMETGRVRTDVAPDTDVQSAPSRPTNLDMQVEQYLNHLIVERGLSANTLAAYRRDLTKYTDFCHAAGITKAQDISGETVTNSPRRWPNRPLGASPWRQHRSAESSAEFAGSTASCYSSRSPQLIRPMI